MKKKFFSGSTLEQAVAQAANHFGIEPSQVSYRRIEKKQGFLKVRPRVVVAVDAEAPSVAAEAATPDATPDGIADAALDAAADATVEVPIEAPIEATVEVAPPADPEPAQPENVPAAAAVTAAARAESESLLELPGAPRRARERFPRAEGDLAEAAHQGLKEIFALAAVKLEGEVLEGDERLEVELWGEDQETLLSSRGSLLLAIQHLLPRVIRGMAGESIHCRVDCDNFHDIRAEQLRDLAQRVASEVRERQRAKSLRPLAPDERRIVHLTLADDPAVETISQGDGLFKRVSIRPAAKGSRGSQGFDPYSR